MSEAVFAREIYRRRKEMNLSLRELARITGIAASTISRIENGRLSPTLDVAAKLALALKLEPSQVTKGQAEVRAELKSVTDIEENALEAPSQVVTYRKLGRTILRRGIRRNLSRIAARNGYEMAILLRGSFQLRTNDGFRENLKAGATINCKLIANHTYFAVPAEEAELLWIA
ncbi:helix-turn-helix domain-containing protein [Microvirga arabica]|uniref:helix-turn-helix domain-containing protein n=1 Tax=Microvirga arabica TaxID=1128671 RepID=UPI00193AB276|nr:helix-turn-helix transcriptional regulator [Microvirga arabica]MBM1174297.1 helix-turn-helix transcriptional regulator [Microvirga arabica]